MKRFKPWHVVLGAALVAWGLWWLTYQEAIVKVDKDLQVQEFSKNQKHKDHTSAQQQRGLQGSEQIKQREEAKGFSELDHHDYGVYYGGEIEGTYEEDEAWWTEQVQEDVRLALDMGIIDERDKDTFTAQRSLTYEIEHRIAEEEMTEEYDAYDMDMGSGEMDPSWNSH